MFISTADWQRCVEGGENREEEEKIQCIIKKEKNNQIKREERLTEKKESKMKRK